MSTHENLYVKNRIEWREWLQNNHLSEKFVWLIYFKKHTNKPSVSYSDAVEEAICFGWIDGQIMKIDDEKYKQRFSPRTSKSLWSKLNIERAKKLITLGKITDIGFKVFSEAMKTNKIVPSRKNSSIPLNLQIVINRNERNLTNFQKFSPSTQLAYIYWINNAKTRETQHRRINKKIEKK